MIWRVMKSKWEAFAPYAIAGAAVLAVLLMVVWFFMRIPIAGTTLAMDWITIRPGVDHWDLSYGSDSLLRITPWSAILLLPLGQLPLNAGWGAVAFLTLIVLTLCVPREEDAGRKWIAGVFTAVFSFLALRTMADGNVEFLTLAGLVLLEAGLLRKSPVVFALGILLTVSKVQETWILMIFLPLVAGREWNSRRWLITIAVLGLAVVPGILWRGREWFASVFAIQDRGSIMDSSLLAAVQRAGGALGTAFLLWIVLFLFTAAVAALYIRGYSREALGFLTAASLLLAPYAAGNNVLIVYAIAVIPLLLARRWEGVLLAILCNLPYLLLPFPDLNYRYSASYWTLVLALTWVLLALRLRGISRRSNPAKGAAKP
jgi:uncharacterized membrane protein